MDESSASLVMKLQFSVIHWINAFFIIYVWHILYWRNLLKFNIPTLLSNDNWTEVRTHLIFVFTIRNNVTTTDQEINLLYMHALKCHTCPHLTQTLTLLSIAILRGTPFETAASSFQGSQLLRESYHKCWKVLEKKYHYWPFQTKQVQNVILLTNC